MFEHVFGGIIGMNIYEKFVRLIGKRRKYFLILFISLNILAFIGLFSININSDLTLFKPTDSTVMKEYNEMAKEFGSVEQLIFW